MKRLVILITVCALALCGIFFYEQAKFNDGRLHVVICDVGQGDAIFIRTPKGQDVLIDGGRNSSVLSCLSNNMPFWDREIELVFATHPDADHIGGLESVLTSYKVLSFNTSEKTTDTQVFKRLQQEIQRQNISLRYIYADDRYSLDSGVSISALWPTREYVSSDTGSFETNTFSLIQILSYGDFKALLTGDIEISTLNDLFSEPYKIDVLKVPHHGSKTGLNSQILSLLNPVFAVISVGSNSYGHPTPFILDLLNRQGIKTLRTDKSGEIEIISDGNTFWINSER
ncbi:MAG: MBL fold metallo-hydrolase [Candidatus Levyibacteriota bacterium]